MAGPQPDRQVGDEIILRLSGSVRYENAPTVRVRQPRPARRLVSVEDGRTDG